MNVYRLSVILIILTIGFVLINSSIIHSSVDELLTLTNSPTAFTAKWQVLRPYYLLTVHKDDLYAVEQALYALSAYQNSGEASESAAAQNQLILALNRIQRNEWPFRTTPP